MAPCRNFSSSAVNRPHVSQFPCSPRLLRRFQYGTIKSAQTAIEKTGQETLSCTDEDLQHSGLSPDTLESRLMESTPSIAQRSSFENRSSSFCIFVNLRCTTDEKVPENENKAHECQPSSSSLKLPKLKTISYP